MATAATQPAFSHRFWRWFCQWPSDVVLWTVLFLGVVLIAFMWRSDLLPGGPQKLILHAVDANDIKPGANVYFMGVLVGTIEDVRIPFNTHRYDVALHARTRRKLPPLPANVEGYIVFNGLAGAKEVHLVPPVHPLVDSHGLGKQVIDIENPIRLRDVMATNMEVSEYLQKGAESFSSIFGSGGVSGRIKALQTNISQAQSISQASTEQSQQLTHFVRLLETRLHQPLSMANQALSPISHNLAHLESKANQVIKTKPLALAQTTLHQLKTGIDGAEAKQQQWSAYQEKLHPTLHQTNQGMAHLQLEGGLTTLNQQLNSAASGLQHARQWVQRQQQNPTTPSPQQPAAASSNPEVSCVRPTTVQNNAN